MIYQTQEEMLAALGVGVREARLAANLTREVVAERSGVSVSALRNLEGGRNASTVTLLQVCRTLRRTDWIQGLAPLEINDALFDRPQTKKRQRATSRRK